MVRLHTRRIRHTLKRTAVLYAASLLVVSVAGAVIALRGHARTLTRTPATPYQEVSFSSAARDMPTLRGWYMPSSGTKVAVFVHGWGGNRATFLDTAEYLQNNGVNVLTFDLRGGSGRSTYGMNESGDVAGAVDWLVKTKGFEKESITVVANSMGGAAAMHYAAREPVERLVLISSVIDLNHTRSYYARDLHLLFPSLYAYGASLVEQTVFGIHPPDCQTDFQHLTIPVLLIHGSSDQKAPVDDWHRAIDALDLGRKEKVTLWEIGGGSHTVFEDNQAIRDEGNKKILRFIQSEQETAL